VAGMQACVSEKGREHTEILKWISGLGVQSRVNKVQS
jgi:hypothetical protein